MSDLIDEVNEELRQERAMRLAKRFGGLFTVLLVFVLAGVGGWQGWQWWQNRQSMASADTFLTATRELSQEGADLKALSARLAASANDAPPGYRTLSRLRAAAVAAEAGERDTALGLWNQVANDGGADSLYRELATLMWGLHALTPETAAEVEARLGPLAANGPWRASAREVMALAALSRGDNAAARQRLQELSRDDAVPQGVRDRAQRLLSGMEG
ncbi:tetratricopeptide repeat protein [Rhodovarius crocodyli]|uniref:Tetratricopeptide repeat protein n=1 Tax=Rhodovarius crocodyli TaxID=1979269 RepID=A0A437MD44_9PROT|nr:tetratricopeptide repeat protein [Rhodovarius crocodyli]RVT95552.1 tetratricopeptide repeat protein [Rhodovarius crocodyli]